MYNTDVEESNRRIIGIDDSKYICCCGCHVISCAKFFSILSIVLSAITLLSSLFSSSSYLSTNHLQIESNGNASWIELETFNSVYNIVCCVIDIILNAGVLYGIYKVKPAALLPYIIVKTFFLIIFGFSIIIGLIILALWIFIGNGKPVIGLGVFVWIIGLFFIGALFVHTSYRAYKYLKEVELRRYPTVYPMQNIPTYK